MTFWMKMVSDNEASIELSWEEVKHAVQEMGFEIKRESVEKTTYAAE
eukprot:CAMPEP_0114582106 /NCGR_PEP_ID=MMETSP0125-20121206/6141_1 /TAXON_ID=485358 ORGANISM="Aristerostoma sp., Strain ATCC 50986" /NCGR_SAMPLE_ID=MMETSP0125 /ASSEMBLY_ACC=CAM_ASM_000245 /LENGTH=46 /DNA_ID= /DNA_START= /DNA_END= /DNA_ORIENTATION=